MSINKSKVTVEIKQCWIFAVLWRPFWKWRPVEIFRCRESIQHVEIEPSKYFYRSPFSKWPPQYRTNSILSDFNDISYVGRLWCPELISNLYDIGQCWIFAVLWRAFGKWRSVEIFQWYRTMLNFYRPFLIPYFGSHFKNGRHLQNFENAELLL
jgi:hypothetical protein